MLKIEESQLGQFSLMLCNTLQLRKWELQTILQKTEDFHKQCFDISGMTDL